MSEEILFHFDGGLASSSKMNFYEAARFQYAAARLFVKIDQFRSSGRFVKKITTQSNKQILLEPHRSGSFDISVLAPDSDDDDKVFLDLPLATVLAYIVERLIGTVADREIAAILNGYAALVDRFGRFNADDPDSVALATILGEPDLRRMLTKETQELLERRVAETRREFALADYQPQLARIDPQKEQKLISMAAPLFTEMATAFRKSANTMEVISRSGGRDDKIIFLNKEIVDEIESSRLDPEITPIIGDIIQYNKETGWGKVRLEEYANPISFSIPSDMKSELQSILLSVMDSDYVYLQLRFVRDKVGEVLRALIVGVLPTPRL